MSGATMTREQLQALGYTCRNGIAIKIPEFLKPEKKERAWPVTSVPLPRPISLVRESVEQNEIDILFRKHGCKVRSTSQRRRSKVALGIPDLWVFGPTGSLKSWWWETKSGTDWEFSIDQLEWAGDCVRNNTLYGAGDRHAAAVFLEYLKLRPVG